MTYWKPPRPIGPVARAAADLASRQQAAREINAQLVLTQHRADPFHNPLTPDAAALQAQMQRVAAIQPHFTDRPASERNSLPPLGAYAQSKPHGTEWTLGRPYWNDVETGRHLDAWAFEQQVENAAAKAPVPRPGTVSEQVASDARSLYQVWNKVFERSPYVNRARLLALSNNANVGGVVNRAALTMLGPEVAPYFVREPGDYRKTEMVLLSSTVAQLSRPGFGM
jgi:hypothetical protein